MHVKFLVCALFYGDYFELAQRCAASIRALRDTGKVDVRIGLNDVTERSAALIEMALPGVDRIVCAPQIYKYPMMRRLVREYHGDATHVMWFDDDSCLQPGLDAGRWLDLVAQHAGRTPGSLGSACGIAQSEVEQTWIRQQPWFTGRSLPETTVYTSGAWFVLPLALFRDFDWPPARLKHNGGDAALGALLYQQGLPVTPFKAGLVISADASLAEATAPRRGYSERPLGI